MLSKKIRIGIADDHSIVRSGLRDYINAQPDMLVVGEAGNGKDAINLLRQTPMDVLILDVEMPARSGIDAIAQLRAMAPQVQLLILRGIPPRFTL